MSAISQPPRQPKYRHFKPRNLAVVRLDGKDHYLGEYDSKESWEKYYQLLADWKRNAGLVATPEPDPQSGFIGISCVIEAYINFATKYYAKNDPAGKEVKCITYALEPLLKLFGLTDANQFGPKSLKMVREHMIGLKWSRKLINARINLIKRCFKWAVAEELVSPTIMLGLQAVQGLRYGRSEAHETEPVRPVADEHVNATLPYLGSVVATMVKLQRITGMRVCEVTLGDTSSECPYAIEPYQLCERLLKECGNRVAVFADIAPYCGALAKYGAFLRNPEVEQIADCGNDHCPEVCRQYREELMDARIAIGFATDDCGTWFPHVWLVQPDGKVLEVGDPFTSYFGVVLSEKGSDALAEHYSKRSRVGRRHPRWD